MSHKFLVIYFLLFGTVACTNNSAFRGGTISIGTTSPVTTPGPPVIGSYCTLVTQYFFKPDGTVPINTACLQANGNWAYVGGFPEARPSSQVSAQFQSDWYNPSMALAANGDLLLTYMRVLSPSPNLDIVMSRYHLGQGWSQVAPVALNTWQNQVLDGNPQFGGSTFELNGVPYYFWTGTGARLSYPNGSSWSYLQIDPSLTGAPRHPEVYPSSQGPYVYLHYGEPSPKVWKFDGTTPVQVGNIAINSATEWTLYTTMTEWNGQPVIAYNSSNALTVSNWSAATDVTKVAVFDGTQWNTISTGIQDTPGQDGMKSFLFTSGGMLYIMYPDYTTTGLPTVSDQIAFRFRVKQWTGSAWQRVGGESDVIYLSQRFEFLNDNGTVLVNVVQPAPNGKDSQEVVLKWNAGVFGYAGNVLQTWSNQLFVMLFRPGSIIKLK